MLIEATGTTSLALTSGNSTALTNLGFAAGPTPPANRGGTGNNGTINTTRQTLAAQFTELRRQIDQLSRDAGFTA